MAGILQKVLDAVPTIIDYGQQIAKTIRDRAKTKKAVEIVNAGGYHTLTPYQRDLIARIGGPSDPQFANLDPSKLPTEQKIIFAGLIFGVILLIGSFMRK